MPKPSDRNRKRRKTQVKVPGGKTVVRRTQRKPSKAKCGQCGADLHGVPRATPQEAKKIPKSSRRPERPYGGNLCTKCTRIKVKASS